MIQRALAIGVMLACGSVFAQPTPPTPAGDEAKKADAKRLYEEGLQHYNLAEYDSAIEKFKAAYAISSAPGLLFNIAQSYRLKKDWEQASNFYLTYLRLKPDAPNRQDVEQRIAEMQKMMEDEKAMKNKPPEGTVTPDGNSAQSSKAPTINIVTAPQDSGSGSQSLITAGYATAGAGLAIVITGVIFGQMAKGAEKELNQLNADMGTWTQEQQDKYDSGKRANTIAVIAFIAGGAAVATGATLWTLGTLRKSDTKLSVDAGKQGASVSLGWAF